MVDWRWKTEYLKYLPFSQRILKMPCDGSSAFKLKIYRLYSSASWLHVETMTDWHLEKGKNSFLFVGIHFYKSACLVHNTICQVNVLWLDIFHRAGTSIVSDICDLSKNSEIAPLTLVSMEKSFFTTYFVSHRKPIWVKICGKYIYRKM